MDKKKFRTIALGRLKSISSLSAYSTDKKINEQLYHIIREKNAKTVMLYIPLGLEVNIMSLIRRLRREGVLVLVPFMVGKSFTLVKYRLPLSVKQYGIKEPKISKQFRKKLVNISVVPITGVDASFRRIGFGKGMYDRFFEKEQNNIDEIIFIQRTLCFSREIITDDFDVRADIVVT